MHWYVIDRVGMATLCKDRDDAHSSAAEHDANYPRNAPHVAAQLRPWTGRSPCANNCEATAFAVEIRLLKASLAGAIEEVESWAAYAPEYFRAKHDLDGTLKVLRRCLDTPKQKGDA